MSRWQDPGTVRRLLADTTVWAVVGLGDNPLRPAYDVARFLQAQGKQVVPVHPAATTALGEPAYPSLAEVPFPVDVVDVFRRPEAAGDVVDEAIAIGAGAVWLQIGVVDEAAGERATEAGLDVVMDTCPKTLWWRYGPGSRASA